LFRGQIRNLVSRLKRGKFLGQELELAAETKEVDIKVKAAEATEPERPLADPSKDNVQQLTDLESENSKTKQFLDEAAKDKPLALVRIWIEIEQELKLLIAAHGLRQLVSRANPSMYIQTLAKRQIISVETASGLMAFYDVRNRVVHGRAGKFTDSDLVALIDSGLRLLEILKAIPRTTAKVQALVPFFSDPAAKVRVEGANAVIFEGPLTRGSDHQRIYPTTRSYEAGQLLSWEWNLSKVWGPSWYRDPENGQVKHGWDSSGEFAGRPIEDI